MRTVLLWGKRCLTRIASLTFNLSMKCCADGTKIVGLKQVGCEKNTNLDYAIRRLQRLSTVFYDI